MLPRHKGFTLLEVCLALMIGLLLITLAVPSIMGVLGEQRLKHSFEAFDRFVQDAKMKSVHERRDYVMAWDDKGITLVSAGATDDAEKKGSRNDAGSNRFVFDKGQSYSLQRTAALTVREHGVSSRK
jgi:prepilin-type N-terminal cleavage/methylation domain-containing protein